MSQAGSSAAPLRRLRTRSAAKRWGSAKERFFPPRTAAADAGGSGEADSQERRPVHLLRPTPDLLDSRSVSTLQDPNQDRGPQAGPTTEPYEETPITDILPFYDYEPERIAATEPDCLMVCPCPEGTDCRKPGGTKECLCPEDYVRQPWPTPPFEGRQFPRALFAWEASNLDYNPLYFEDAPLERYGHTYHPLLQPFASVHRFAGQLVLLPYQATINPVRRKISPLGHYRPGEWAPKLHYQVPLSAKAGAVEAGAVTGMFLIFP